MSDYRIAQNNYHPPRHFRFVKTDLGKGRRAPGASGDCTVQALALAGGLRYEDAWQLLYQVQGRYKSAAFDLVHFLRLEPELFGVVRQIDFPAKRGERRMTPITFAERYPVGSFILNLAHHVAPIEEGVLHDKWDCSVRCVYTAWEINSETLKQRIVDTPSTEVDR